VCSEEAAVKIVLAVIGFVFLLIVQLEIWFFTVLLACYHYLCDKLVAAASLPTTATVYPAQLN
jgi:hypothetical protein